MKTLRVTEHLRGARYYSIKLTPEGETLYTDMILANAKLQECKKDDELYDQRVFEADVASDAWNTWYMEQDCHEISDDFDVYDEEFEIVDEENGK